MGVYCAVILWGVDRKIEEFNLQLEVNIARKRNRSYDYYSMPLFQGSQNSRKFSFRRQRIM